MREGDTSEEFLKITLIVKTDHFAASSANYTPQRTSFSMPSLLSMLFSLFDLMSIFDALVNTLLSIWHRTPLDVFMSNLENM